MGNSIKIMTASTRLRHGYREGHEIEISPSTRRPARKGGLELNITKPFPAKASLTKLGATDYWKTYVLSCATSPLIAHWLIEMSEPRTGRIGFPFYKDSPFIDFDLQPVKGGWQASLFTYDHGDLLARISGGKKSWEPLSDWQYAD